MARRVNHAKIHYSGNCPLLAYCFLDSCHKKRLSFVVDNLKEWHESLRTTALHLMIFGKELTTVGNCEDVGSMNAILLYEYRMNPDHRFYVIAADYHAWFASFLPGHCFNAVILQNDKGEPYVQYVDPWRTIRSPMISPQQLDREMPSFKQTFTILRLED